MKIYRLVLALLLLASCHDARGEDDRVIRGGWIVDGTGAPRAEGDVAIRGDHSVAVGFFPGRGTTEIDAKGLLVAPGFIDMPSHSAYLLLEDGAAQSKIRQGVTTEVFGEESSGGPMKGNYRGRARLMVDTEGSREWATLGAYFETLEKSKTS